MVDKVGTPYRVLLYQPGIRFSLRTNTKVSSLQHLEPRVRQFFLTKRRCYLSVEDDKRVSGWKTSVKWSKKGDRVLML